MALTLLWHTIQGYLLFPLGILLHSLWHTRGHPIETVYVLLSAFDGQYYSRHIDFRITRYYGRLTRARMQSDLRSALVDTFFNPGDAIVVALGQATVEATTGRKVNVWTQDRFAAFVASRLGGNSGVAPILWRSFCYSALYPFTLRLAACPAEDQQLDLNEWVQAVAMLATDAANNVHYARPVTSITGRSIWYEFTCLAVCSGPQQHHPRSDPSNASSDETRPPTVLEQVAYIASAQLPLDYAIRGPRLPEILPHVRKLVNDAECEPVVETDFAIPYRDMLCLFGAVLQVHKPDLDAARRNTWLFKNRGLGLTTTDIDRATHLAVAKQILAVAGVYDQDEDGDVTISYKQYEALWNRLYLTTNEPWHRGEKWSFHHELGLLWRSLFSVVSVVDDLKGLNHNSRGIDETPNHPPPPLVLQALDFLYPLPSCGCTRQRRRKHTLQYTSAAGGGLSREGVLAALTKHYRPTLVVLYGHTTDKRRQSALFAVLMSSPLWCTCHSGRIDDFFVDDKHLLLEMAPRARVLQYQPATNKHKTIFADLVEIDDMADTISFGSRSGLLLDLAAGVATLSSAVEPADAGHYVEIPTGPPQTTTPEAMAAPAAWTTSMHITKLEVYTASDGVDQNLAVMRGLRSIRRRPEASVGRDR
ncbi:hypothetical protein SEUCBS139899_005761 [Sporothrix eucalyptigena]